MEKKIIEGEMELASTENVVGSNLTEQDQAEIANELQKMTGMKIDPKDLPAIDSALIESGMLDILKERAEKYGCKIQNISAFVELRPETNVVGKNKVRIYCVYHTDKWNRSIDEKVSAYSPLDLMGGMISKLFRDMLQLTYDSNIVQFPELEIHKICLRFKVVGTNLDELELTARTAFNGELIEKLELKELFGQ